jgi:uncharacterized protein (DUF1778 family)
MKMGRPKIKKSEQKTEMIGIRLKSQERNLVEKAAEKSKQRLSEWTRSVLISSAKSQIEN